MAGCFRHTLRGASDGGPKLRVSPGANFLQPSGLGRCLIISPIWYYSVTFVQPDGHRSQPFYFFKSPAHFAPYGRALRDGVENMRKLVYAFYEPKFSFKEVIKAHPEAGGWITDCLSGDVNKDYTQLWAWIREFVPLPDDLPYGEPLLVETAAA